MQNLYLTEKIKLFKDLQKLCSHSKWTKKTSSTWSFFFCVCGGGSVVDEFCNIKPRLLNSYMGNFVTERSCESLYINGINYMFSVLPICLYSFFLS